MSHCSKYYLFPSLIPSSQILLFPVLYSEPRHPLQKWSLASLGHTKSHTFSFTSPWSLLCLAHCPEPARSQSSVFQYISPTSAGFWQKRDSGNRQLANSSSQQMHGAGKEGNSVANGADGAWPYCVHIALPFNEKILSLVISSPFCGCCRPKTS